MSQLDNLATEIPQELRVKLMQHFGIAKEYEKSAETLSITYYCLMYIANEAIKLQKDKQFVAHVLDYLEATKRSHPHDEIMKSMVTGQATIEELITVLVSEANEAEEDQYKNTDQLRMLMRKHYTVGGLTDVLSVFGPVKDDFLTLGKIAKSRAVTIFRDLKAGGGSAPAAAPRPPEFTASPPQMPQPRAANPSAGVYYNQASDNKDVPHNVITEAQKLCRYANSALEHEDIATAVTNCEQVLQLLRPYHH